MSESKSKPAVTLDSWQTFVAEIVVGILLLAVWTPFATLLGITSPFITLIFMVAWPLLYLSPLGYRMRLVLLRMINRRG